MHAGEDTGCQHGRRKPRAFLVCPVGDDDRVLGLDAEVVHGADDFQRAEHAENAVIFAAGRLGVEMAADIDRQCVRIGAGAGRKHRAHPVDADAQAFCLAPRLEEVAAFAVGVRQRLAIVAAGNAGADLRHVHEHVPQTVAVDAQVLAGCCHHFFVLACFPSPPVAGGMLFVPVGPLRTPKDAFEDRHCVYSACRR